MKKILLMTTMLLGFFTMNAQNRTTIAVIGMEAINVNTHSGEVSNLTRIALEKLDKFTILDKHDVEFILKQNNIDISKCNGKSCLMEAGKVLHADRVLSGSVTRIGKKIILQMRMIDMTNNNEEKLQTDEYLPLEENLPEMIGVSLGKMFDLPVSKSMEDLLTKNENLDNSINNPGVTRLVLNGPRIGVVYMTGDIAQRIMDDKRNGGWEGYPYMTIFGYQHEIQYLNEGNFQALFEFVGAIGGLDQNMFNPSLSILDGFRSNVNGWEFALGPNFSLAPVAKGYYDATGTWVKLGTAPVPEGTKIVERLDSRGVTTLSSSFVFSVGKSFRSGKMNIPLNFFVIPKRDGWRMGMSFGFNAKRKEY